jgi:succinate dehydrogenase/fumarate reductase flavoprotein subunit
MLADALPLASASDASDLGPVPQHLSQAESQRLETLIASLQASMWANAGLLREASSLRHGLAAQAETESTLAEIAAIGRTSRRLAEAQAMSRAAQAILISALARTESRGAHFRSDHPRHDDANFRKHSVFSSDGNVRFEVW